MYYFILINLHILSVNRAIAASAPIWQFTGMTPCDGFSRVLTSAFTAQSSACSENIKASWNAITNITSNGMWFILCKKLLISLNFCLPLIPHSIKQIVGHFKPFTQQKKSKHKNLLEIFLLFKLAKINQFYSYMRILSMNYASI